MSTPHGYPKDVIIRMAAQELIETEGKACSWWIREHTSIPTRIINYHMKKFCAQGLFRLEKGMYSLVYYAPA